MPSFDLAKQYAKRHGLIERSTRFPQGLAALKSLATAEAVRAFDWDDYRGRTLFDHTRVFVRSANAKNKAWRVGFSPYPSSANISMFQEVADALGIRVVVGDEAHRTYEIAATIPVMYFRK